MIKILFVCHGNICRSPMAEYLFRYLAEERNTAQQFQVASAATSREEIGNPVHPGTLKKLKPLGISAAEKRAVQMTRQDYITYDYLIGMDEYNIRNMLHITGGDPKQKMFRLLDLSQHPRDVADPWYTGDFDATFQDIREGCLLLLEHFCSSSAPLRK